MAEPKVYPTLSKAPIILAILEIKFSCPEIVTNNSLLSLKKLFKDSYPTHNTLSSVDIQFKPELEKTPISVKSTNLDGHAFISLSKKHEIFISKDTFTFKQHGEYSNWADFKKQALDAWAICSTEIKPINTHRLSIRYINSVEIPMTNNLTKQQDIFKTFIACTGVLTSKPIGNYFLKYTHPPGEDKITVHYGQELKNGDGKRLPFIIDIDVLYNNEELSNLTNLKSKFDELREIKNKYFFDNLTDTTLSLIK